MRCRCGRQTLRAEESRSSKGRKRVCKRCVPEGRVLLMGLTRSVPSLPAVDKQKAKQFAVSWTSTERRRQTSLTHPTKMEPRLAGSRACWMRSLTVYSMLSDLSSLIRTLVSARSASSSVESRMRSGSTTASLLPCRRASLSASMPLYRVQDVETTISLVRQGSKAREN
jgi:hypothetical protein